MLWQHKTVVFLCWSLISAVPLSSVFAKLILAVGKVFKYFTFIATKLLAATFT
jgi:hypothetical protein